MRADPFGPSVRRELGAGLDQPVEHRAGGTAVDGPLARSFRVDTFPTYFAVEHGHVMAAVGSTDELSELLAR